MKDKELKNYWKIEDIKKLIEIEKQKNEKTTITENYVKSMETQVRLMKEAQDFARKEARKETLKEELVFLEKLRDILNKYHSQIPMVEIGRQNVLDDIDNELDLDNRIIIIKQQLRKNENKRTK